MSDPILQLNNIEAAYGAVKAIRGVSLNVAPGSIVTVLGSNGAGKTTILKTISGILDPQKGSIVFRHDKLEGRDPAWIVRQGLVHVPEGREIFPLLTVRENLLMGAYTRPSSQRDEVAKDIEDVFSYFPILKERTNQPAGQLSGGQQQMLATARALCAKPDFLLLDEPGEGLMPTLVGRLLDTIVALKARRVGVLLVEQKVDAVLRVADRVALIENGRIARHATPAELAAEPEVLLRYVGVRR